MPAKSKKQQMFMGAELTRKREGKKTKTGMTEKQLKEFASTPRKNLPPRAKKAKPSHYQQGGVVQRSGMAQVHKGETILPPQQPLRPRRLVYHPALRRWIVM